MRRSARARRISLRVSALDGQVTLTLPPRVAERSALAFAEERADWIVQALRRLSPQARVEDGARFPLEGREFTLEFQPLGRGAVRIEGERLIVPGAQPQARLLAFLKQCARLRLIAASDRYAAALGRPYSGLTLRDTRSRWGSCTAGGALNYSWRLILAPPQVLDYVAAHEVAHLAEMNHSPRFWAVVERLYPGWQVPRDWLKSQGGALHSWRFET